MRKYIQYFIKRAKSAWIKLAMVILSLSLCYLSIGFILSYSTLQAKLINNEFKKIFPNSSYILSTSKGLEFKENGKLDLSYNLKDSITEKIKKKFDTSQFYTVSNDSTNKICFLSFNLKSDVDTLQSFALENNISIVSTFSGSNNDGLILIDLKGLNSRFNIFTFSNQLTASVLGKNFSSAFGNISFITFIVSLLFSIYITSLFWLERIGEFQSLFYRGHLYFLFKYSMLEIVTVNVFGLILSELILLFFFNSFFQFNLQVTSLMSSVFFVIPYFIVVTLIQILVFANKIYSLNEK